MEIAQYQVCADRYNKIAKRWKQAYALVGMVGIASSSLSASNVWHDVTSSFAVVSAICFGLMGFANPEKQAIKYDRAANLLNVSIAKFSAGLIGESDFLHDYEIALSILTAEIDTKRPASS